MKKLILLTLTLLCLSSCNHYTHVQYPVLVYSVKANDEIIHPGKYIVVCNSLHNGEYLNIYTDSLYQVGDTIK